MSETPSSGSPSWLLVSDIDDTLTGDDAAMTVLGQALQAHRGRLRFAVNSSRPSASVARTLEDIFPPELRPDAVITALGTEISICGKKLPDWEARFTGWPHERMFRLLERLGHRPHAAQFQTPRKVSFAVPAGAAQDAARAEIAAQGIACRIIASGVDDFDVIPPNAGKDAATLALAASFSCDLSRVIVAGDSGNDLAMFQAVQNRIAVANARPELTNRLEAGCFYHSTQPHAAGVLEGLIHFGALPGDTEESRHRST